MLHTLIFSYWKSATFSELTGSRLQIFARAALFVFLNDPSAVDNAHGRGPSGWLRTSLIWSFRFSAINIIWVNRFLSAFSMISFDLHLFVQVGKCLQLCLRDCVMELSFSWLWLQSLFTKYFIRLLSNSFNSKQILLYLWRGHFSNGKKYQILLHATEWVKPVTLEHCYQGLNTGLISDNSGALEIGVIEIWFI